MKLKNNENSKDVIVPLRNHLSNVSKKVKELELFENIEERMEKFNEKTNGKIEVKTRTFRNRLKKIKMR